MNRALFFVISIILMNLASLQAQVWKQYPYNQPGSVIFFPVDEGNHPNHPDEWWYMNAHLRGLTTGKTYSVMLTFFYKQTSGTVGYRIFNIADDSLKQFYPHAIACNYTSLSTSHLNIQALTTAGTTERFVTKRNAQNQLIPFEYQISAASPSGSMQLNCVNMKRPLMIGDDGYMNQGSNGYTYYYSFTQMNITGTITLNGLSESVIGVGWFDHQYGLLESTVQETYEWFSIQLSNGMAVNLWNIFTNQNLIPNSPNYKFCTMYLNEQSDTTFSNFELRRLKYTFMPVSGNCYSQKWRFIWGNFDLTFTTVQTNCELLSPSKFYEGSMTVQGTVNGLPVTGIGFAELIHKYKKPIIDFLPVKKDEKQQNSISLRWNNVNPDDGCPLFYDVELSNNNGATFKDLAKRILQTQFSWDTTGSGVRNNSLLRVTGYSIDSTLSGFDTTRYDSIVPVDMIVFEVTAVSNGALLKWSTIEELNNLGFEIQRSQDRINFMKIGFVEGRGTTTTRQDYKFLDNEIKGGKYWYRLKQIDFSGDYKYSDIVVIEWKPDIIALAFNYPNPFNPATKIQYQLNYASHVTLKIYDVLGNQVSILVNEEKEAGYHSAEFDASGFSSGVYFYELKAGQFTEIKKMLLMR